MRRRRGATPADANTHFIHKTVAAPSLQSCANLQGGFEHSSIASNRRSRPPSRLAGNANLGGPGAALGGFWVSFGRAFASWDLLETFWGLLEI